MFYLTFKFHDNRVNTFGFIEGEGAFEAPPPPPPQAQELQKKPRRNRVKASVSNYMNFGNHDFAFVKRKWFLVWNDIDYCKCNRGFTKGKVLAATNSRHALSRRQSEHMTF